MEERISSLGAIKEAKEETKILEKMQQEKEQKPVKYKRADIIEGYLTDEVEVEAFKVTQTYDVVFNNMLGDYDEDGEYIIASDILEALIKCHKHITRAYADTLYLQSYQKFGDKGNIEFTLSFVKNNEGKQVAVLKVLEPVNKVGGYLINTHSIVVGTYTDVNDDMYMTKVKKVFHIYDSEEEGGKDDLVELNALMLRLELLAKIREILLKNLAKDEEKYFNERLNALKQTQFEEIMKEFEVLKQKSAMFLNPSSQYYFFYLNQILDMALYNTRFTNPNLYKEAMTALKQVMQEYSKEMAQRFKQANEAVNQKEKVVGAQPKQEKEKSNTYFYPKAPKATIKNKDPKAIEREKPGPAAENQTSNSKTSYTSNVGQNTYKGQEANTKDSNTRDYFGRS